MKQHLRNIVLAILTGCARMRLRRMRAGGMKIIGITGSIGKTTCKEAVAHVLRGASGGPSRVLSSDKSYNTEFGLPLTILGLQSEFSSVVGWAKNLALAMWRGIFARGDYDFLILEMGVDKPGDMDQLLGILRGKTQTGSAAPLHCAVFTGIHPVHMADGQFASLEAIAEEKGKIMSAVLSEKDGGVALINGDDAWGRKLGENGGAKVILYGMGEGVDLAANGLRSGWDGLEFVVEYGEVQGEFRVPILGAQHVGSLLAAIGCGLAMGMRVGDIVERMKSFKLPPGRLSLIEAKNGAWILDSSYNASPDAVRAAVGTLNELANQKRGAGSENGNRELSWRKVLVYGNMNELGARSEEEHRAIGRFLAEDGGRIDMLVTVGEYSAKAAEEYKKSVHSFPDAESAADFLEKNMQCSDLILVKGSQNNVRLEKLVKRLMRQPERARELLVRQDW